MELFTSEKPLVGMIHLVASSRERSLHKRRDASDCKHHFAQPRSAGNRETDAALVEDLGDVPFAKRAATDTIAIMIIEEIMRKACIPIGVNMLREGQ